MARTANLPGQGEGDRMSGTSRGLCLGIACCLLFAALPASASALSYCVSKPSCVSSGGVNEGSDLQGALDDAALTTVADRVEIGPGTFHSDGSEGFYYSGAGATNSIRIVGAGVAKTKLTAPDAGPANAVTTLDVQGGQGASVVSNLGIEAPGSTGCCEISEALRIVGTA